MKDATGFEKGRPLYLVYGGHGETRHGRFNIARGLLTAVGITPRVMRKPLNDHGEDGFYLEVGGKPTLPESLRIYSGLGRVREFVDSYQEANPPAIKIPEHPGS